MRLTCLFMVGVTRFELVASSVSGKRSPPELNARSVLFFRTALPVYRSYSLWQPIILKRLEATPGFEPGVKALQASALPLGHVATIFYNKSRSIWRCDRLEQAMERTTGFEPATPTLARWCSTS